MARSGRRFRDAAYPTLEYGEPEDDQIQLPYELGEISGRTMRSDGSLRSTPANPNRMLASVSPDASAWDFLTGSADRREPPYEGGLRAPVGPQPEGGGGRGGGPMGMGGGGRGRAPEQSPFAGFFNPDAMRSTFDSFLADSMMGAAEEIGPDEYLASKRGTSLEQMQRWNPTTDSGFYGWSQAQAEGLARQRGENWLNPLVRSRLTTEVMGTGAYQRAYQVERYGYDPVSRRMITPAGYDPYADPEFLRYSQGEASRRGMARAAAQEAVNPRRNNMSGVGTAFLDNFFAPRRRR